MKILDRYILTSIAGAFLFGVAMFMALLMAMELLPELIKLIAEQGVPAGLACTIMAYQLPGLLVYAFPMSILLCILLVFNRMSSESEMVAIRAGGVGFARIVVPALFFALLVTGLTYWISDSFMPHARMRSSELRRAALHALKSTKPTHFMRQTDGTIAYTLTAGHLDVRAKRMHNVGMIYHEQGVPAVFIFADTATWDPKADRWTFHHASLRVVKPGLPGWALQPEDDAAKLAIQTYVLRIKESPLDLDPQNQKPEDFTATQLRERIEHLIAIDTNQIIRGKWQMELARRYSVPFSCLVFALIGAPLGLRHHRTSSAMGLGISLIVIFIYYFITSYLGTLGESGAMPPAMAAWIPNILGAAVGLGLMVKANQ